MAALAAQLPLRVDPNSVNACPGEPDVEFVRDAHASLCAVRGPEDAVRRAHAEIEFRALQFSLRIQSVPANAQPDYRLVDRETKRQGECQWCGVELPSFVGGSCNLCGAALRKALRAAGRIA